jgi:hypothetical protein
VTELAPGWPLVVEETTENHCVATCGDVVLVFAYEGSHADVQHVDTAARVIESLSRQRRDRARLLFVLPEAHASPPSARVRSAIVDAAKRVDDRLSKGCLVVSGSGFSAAIHRGALTGIMALARPRAPFLVTSNLRAALGHLLGAGAPVLEPLLRFCEERRAAGPPSKRE